MEALPLFVQDDKLRLKEIDVIGLPYISVFDKHVGEWRKIVLVCAKRENLVENTIGAERKIEIDLGNSHVK